MIQFHELAQTKREEEESIIITVIKEKSLLE